MCSSSGRTPIPGRECLRAHRPGARRRRWPRVRMDARDVVPAERALDLIGERQPGRRRGRAALGRVVHVLGGVAIARRPRASPEQHLQCGQRAGARGDRKRRRCHRGSAHAGASARTRRRAELHRDRLGRRTLARPDRRVTDRLGRALLARRSIREPLAIHETSAPAMMRSDVSQRAGPVRLDARRSSLHDGRLHRITAVPRRGASPTMQCGRRPHSGSPAAAPCGPAHSWGTRASRLS
jgi:hypothetical protein